MNGDELVHFNSLHGMFGSIRIAKKYVSKNTLETLFQTSKGAILLDQEAEEVLPLENGLYPDLDPNITYTVVDEEHLEKFTEDEQRFNIGLSKW
jgi:hypothetical protein